MPYVSKIRSTSSAVVMVLLATLLCVATKAQAQNLPPLETHLNPSETALILVDFQYPFTNPAGDSYGAVKNEIEGGMLDRTVKLVKKARELGGIERFSQQVNVVHPHEHVTIVVVRHLMHACQPEGVRTPEAASIRAEGRDRNSRLRELVEWNRVGKTLRIRDLPVHVAQVADAVTIDPRVVKLVRREST